MLNNDMERSKQKELLEQICILAMEWRGQVERRPAIQVEYARVYEELRLLNWDFEFDVDCLLPEENMPQEYIAHYPFVASKEGLRPPSWRTNDEIENMEKERQSKR